MFREPGLREATPAPSNPEARISILLLAALLILHIALSRYTLFPRDEGYHVDIAERILLGQRPFRDVYIDYPPTIYYLHAAVFKIFGVHLSVLRVASAVTRALSGFLAYRLARQALSPGKASLAALISLAFTLRPTAFHVMPAPAWYAMTTQLMCALFAERYLSGATGRPAFWAGFWAGITCIIRQHAGLPCVAALTIILGVGPGHPSSMPRLVRPGLCLLGVVMLAPLFAVNTAPTVFLGIFLPAFIVTVTLTWRVWREGPKSSPPVGDVALGLMLPLLGCLAAVASAGSLPAWWQDIQRTLAMAKHGLTQLPFPLEALVLGAILTILASLIHRLRLAPMRMVGLGLFAGALCLWLGARALLQDLPGAPLGSSLVSALTKTAAVQLMVVPWLLAVPLATRPLTSTLPLRGVAILAVFVQASMAPRYDEWRSFDTGGPGIVLLAAGIARSLDPSGLRAWCLVPAVACLILRMIYTSTFEIGASTGRWAMLYPPKADVYVPLDHLPRLLPWWKEIERLTKPGESVVVVPEATLAHFALGRRNPLRYSVLFPGSTSSEEVQREMIQAIEADKTRLVVQMPDHGWPFEKYHRSLAQYTRTHYRVVREIPLPYTSQPVRFWWRVAP